jgi:serine/threonine-protein kinase HipA
VSGRIGAYYLEQKVGELTGTGTETLFQYDPDFLRGGIELSPVLLKLAPAPFRGHQPAFDYLPPLFADSLPDRFGRTIMNQWFTEKMGLGYRAAPLERLAYVGENGMGALCYRPSLETFPEAILREFDLRRQEKLARSSQGQLPSEFIEAAKNAARTVGGSFPKALCAEDPATGLFYQDDPRLPASFKRWIIKFGLPEKDRDDLLNFPEVELAYNRMARDAGIDVPACRLIASDEDKIQHFAIERFDWTEGKRLHMQTLSAITGVPAAETTLDYRNLLSTTHELTGDITQVKEAFRRMVFNVASHNVDDHGKNHTYLYADKTWKLSPAYDVTFADAPNPDQSAVAARAMPVGGKVIDINGRDLLRLGERAGISKSHCRGICDQTFQIVSRIGDYLKEAHLPENYRREIAGKVEFALKEGRRHLI